MRDEEGTVVVGGREEKKEKGKEEERIIGKVWIFFLLDVGINFYLFFGIWCFKM